MIVDRGWGRVWKQALRMEERVDRLAGRRVEFEAGPALLTGCIR
jgi:hypothetical protein